jgi:hypothetical protein
MKSQSLAGIESSGNPSQTVSMARQSCVTLFAHRPPVAVSCLQACSMQTFLGCCPVGLHVYITIVSQYIVRYDTHPMDFLGNSFWVIFTMEKFVRYSALSYRIAIVRVLWRTIAQNPGTVRLCMLHVPRPTMATCGDP